MGAGNILVREGKDEEGFREIRKAVAGDPKFAVPAASLAWDLNGGDIAKVEKMVGDSLPVKASLAGLLAGQKRFDESLKMWRSIPPKVARTDYEDAGKRILSELLKAKKFVLAVRLTAELDGSASPAVGKVTNPGFEEDVSVKAGSGFEWTVPQGGRPAIGVSVEEKHSGGKSLVMIFDGRALKTLRPLSQAVAVLPGREYTLQAFYKSDLDAQKTLLWDVVDAATGKVIAESEPFTAATGWTTSTVTFTAPDDSEAVVLQLVREKCLANECSIKGKLWIDDVNLK